MQRLFLTTAAVTFLLVPCIWSGFVEDPPTVEQQKKTIVKKTIRIDIDTVGKKFYNFTVSNRTR